MNVLIEGTGDNNKGAELMLLAVLNELEHNGPDELKLFFGRGELKTERLNELKLTNYKTPQHLKLLLYNLPVVKIPKKYNLDLVLDASGFRYGDFMLKKRTLYFNFKEYLKYRFFKKVNARIVFLPQAFGPFTRQRARLSAKTVLKFGNLVYARDKKSYGFLSRVAKKTANKIKTAPDFTNLLEAKKTKPRETGVCIIPNSKILANYTKTESDVYVQFLAGAIDYFSQMGEKVYLLRHTVSDDLALCQKVADRVKEIKPADVFLNDPLQMKGFIGSCKFVVSSRFHGTINSLSQGVSTICVGWSHKYELLMQDYQQTDALVKIQSLEEMLTKLKAVYNNGNLLARKQKIEEMSVVQKNKAKQMWAEIHHFMDAHK